MKTLPEVDVRLSLPAGNYLLTVLPSGHIVWNVVYLYDEWPDLAPKIEVLFEVLRKESDAEKAKALAELEVDEETDPE